MYGTQGVVLWWRASIHYEKMTYFTKEGVLFYQLICSTKSKEKLAAIVVRTTICHGNQTTPVELESRMELILMRARGVERGRVYGGERGERKGGTEEGQTGNIQHEDSWSITITLTHTDLEWLAVH